MGVWCEVTVFFVQQTLCISCCLVGLKIITWKMGSYQSPIKGQSRPLHWYRWLNDREFQRCRLNGHRLGAAGCIEEGLRASLNQLLLLTLPAACGAGAPLNKEHPAWLPWPPCLSWPPWPPSWPPSWLSTSLPSRCLSCSECPAYICLSARVLCDYCGCPPARHVISFVLIIPKLCFPPKIERSHLKKHDNSFWAEKSGMVVGILRCSGCRLRDTTKWLRHLQSQPILVCLPHWASQQSAYISCLFGYVHFDLVLFLCVSSKLLN